MNHGMLLQCMKYDEDTNLYSLEHELNQYTQLITRGRLWYKIYQWNSYSDSYTTLVFQMTCTHKIEIIHCNWVCGG